MLGQERGRGPRFAIGESSAPPAFFGYAADNPPQTIEVPWPDGGPNRGSGCTFYLGMLGQERGRGPRFAIGESSTPSAFFGYAADNPPQTIEVPWPDGTRQSYGFTGAVPRISVAKRN